MTPQELQATLTRSGIPCRIHRNEVAIQVCVFCGNVKFNLECNAEMAVFHSWCCRRGGRLDQLLRDLTGEHYRLAVQKVEKDKPSAAPQLAGDFQSTPVSEVGSALAYLEHRGITAEVAKSYGIAYVNQPGHQLHGRIVIPAKNYWTGAVEGWTGRSYTGKLPKYITAMTRKIITGWRQRSHAAAAVLVEGPLDGVAVHRAGHHAAVLSGVGGSGVEDWAARLAPEVRVVIMLDGDAAQQAERLYWKITVVRKAPALVRLPPSADPASVGHLEVARLVKEAISTGSGT